MPEVTQDTVQLPNGSWSYRILSNGTVRLQSGGFLFRSDAENVGAHWAADRDIASHFKD